MTKIAVFDNRLLASAQEHIQALATAPVKFPKTRCATVIDMIAQTADADIVLVSPWDKVTAEYLDACPNIRYVGLCGTSTANIDLAELAKRHIAFKNVVSHHKEAVAEYIFMQLVRLARGVGEYQWRQQQHQLMGKPLGIIGLGAVGQAIAHLALAYKMDVWYSSPHRKPDWEQRGLQYSNVTTLATHCPIIVMCSPTNIQVLGKREFSAMQPGSILVQACSGTPFDRAAFLNWIAQDGNYAIFDMSAGVENCRQYKDIPRVVFPDIIGGDTYESHDRRGKMVLYNLKEFLEGTT